MDKIVIYPRADLAAIVQQGAAGAGSTAAWLDDMLRKVAGMLRERPAVYRTFGPYWWPVKAQLVAAGLLAGEVQPSQVEIVTTGDDALDMAGAVAYHGYNVEHMRDDAVFSLDTEGGDQIDYLLADEEFDAVIAAATP